MADRTLKYFDDLTGMWTNFTTGDKIDSALIPAGAFQEYIYEFSARNHPIELNAGQLLSIAVGPSAMDAAGTWALGVEVNWHESTTYTG